VEDEAALDADESSLMSGLKDDMVKLLERLPAREAAVMRMRYGLDGEAYTLDDIGRLLKVWGRGGAGWVGGVGCVCVVFGWGLGVLICDKVLTAVMLLLFKATH